VSGGESGATEATLSIMVGAERADFDEVKSILDTMGTTVVLVGHLALDRPSRRRTS
jgi:2-hydroxy-3-oxopropionate reductase